MPIVRMQLPGAQEALLELASDAQLDWVDPTMALAFEQADVNISIGADENSRALTELDPTRQQRLSLAHGQFFGL